MFQHHRYTQYSLINTGSDWSISTCIKYYLAYVDSADVFLMKNSLALKFIFKFWSVLVLFVRPVWDFLSSYGDLVPLLLPDHQGSSNLCFLCHLNHHCWSLWWDLHLAKKLTLVHIPTCYLHSLIGRYLFWSPQSISPDDCLPMLLIWCKIWCLIHIHDWVEPWFIVYFPSCLMIPLIFFWAYLDPHKRQALQPILVSVAFSRNL